MSSAIYFFTENITFNLKRKTLIRDWVRSVIWSEQKQAGNINFIFCDDDYLSKINVKYLKHNTLTDIVTFSYGENQKEVTGDIFISLPRVKENAKIFKVTSEIELYRVMIHGILHLMGYTDLTKEEKEAMRNLENSCLEKLKEME